MFLILTILLVLIGFLIIISAMAIMGGFTVGAIESKRQAREAKLRGVRAYTPEELAQQKKIEARRRALVDDPNETPEDRKRKKRAREEAEVRRRYLNSLVDR